MADKKISALTAASTPLAGTEVLPIVQSSTTKQVSVANLTAGRTFEALGVTLTSTDAGAAAAPLIDLYRDSATPAASDTLGEIEFNGEDSAGNKQTYGVIHASILSPTSTAEQGQLHFETATAGALTEKMIIGTTNLVINEIGAVFNVRIEGDTDANLFYTDATNDKVGIGTASPAEKLDVVGKIKVSDNIVIGTSGKGIDFSITSSGSGTMTSELLADYEEGTWTPTLTGSSTNPTVTYGLQRGLYTRIGRLVTVSVYMTWSAFSGGSGDLYISGLPFTVEGGVGAYGAASIASLDGITYGVATTAPGLLVLSGTTSLRLACFGSAVTTITIPTSSVASSGNIVFTCTYSV